MSIESSISEHQLPASIVALMLTAAIAPAIATPNAYGQDSPSPNIAGPHGHVETADGLRPDGTPYPPDAVANEKALIEHCRGIGQVSVSRVATIKLPALKNSANTLSSAVVTFDRRDMSECNGYTERIFVGQQLETRAPGQKAWHLGAERVAPVTTNTGKLNNKVRLSLGQKLKPGESLRVRLVDDTRLRSTVAAYPGFDYLSLTPKKPTPVSKTFTIKAPTK